MQFLRCATRFPAHVSYITPRPWLGQNASPNSYPYYALSCPRFIHNAPTLVGTKCQPKQLPLLRAFLLAHVLFFKGGHLKRAGKVVALEHVAADFAQEKHLLFGFDALGDDRNAQLL